MTSWPLYAEERSREQDPPEHLAGAASRLYTHYVATARAAGPRLAVGAAAHPRFATPGEAASWLDAERDNLLAVARAAPGLGQPTAQLILHFALFGYLVGRRHLDDAAGLAARAVRTARATRSPQDLRPYEPALLSDLGSAQRELRRFDAAVTSYRTALAAHERLRGPARHRSAADRHFEAFVLSNLGLAFQQAHRPHRAIRVLKRSLALFPPDSDPRSKGMAYTNLGMALFDVGRYEEAIAAYEEDLAVCRRTGDRRGEGVTLNHLGMALRETGHPHAATEAHTGALAAARETGDPYDEAMALSNLGVDLTLTGDLERAVELAGRAVERFRAFGDVHHARTRPVSPSPEPSPTTAATRRRPTPCGAPPRPTARPATGTRRPGRAPPSAPIWNSPAACPKPSPPRPAPWP
ncbi:tetratricopeptide repeat protein [Streptomyces sp. PmtG]